MKYIKQFERLSKYKVGDYIVIEYNWNSGNDILYNLKGFIDSTIGVLYGEEYDKKNLVIRYDNVPEELVQFFTKIDSGYIKPFYHSQMVGYSEKKEDLEYLINANKFNI